MSPVREEGDALLDDLLAPLDGEAGPARRISRQKSAALVGAVLAAVAVEEAASARQPIRKPKRPPMWLMAGALVLTGAAAATVWRFAFSEPMSEPREAVRPVVRPAPAGAPVAAEGTPPGVSPASPGDDVAAVEAPVPAPVTPAGSSEASPKKATPPTRLPRRDAPSQALSTVAPEDLLRKANELRAGGRWKEADALYVRVIRAEPASLASYVARVASGSLRLEHLGDARGALRHFQEALRLQPQGVLGQEARHGIAEAYRALGDAAAEARALESFLASHPDSPLGKTARARLRELSAP
ncbi:tetratricopeptide repeat protein [Pyxidicoccus sp. MSG2]|uniref:tetratricopeptide repeat protein n=1 Tax=Pyxidicoccus sp. MSG2 TaxID=2996790 RepID=UPI00226F5DBD|nr:tetratricopeptide repeat protein [Pyxidicoccus sp. MSG2]MCY1014902.1 tetratricopeptide repeat protein [Pyxidicoccus sp. MSG2]